METIRYVVKMKSLDEIWRMRPLGDIHYGNPGCDLEKLQESIDLIANDPFYLTLGMGDYVEANTIDGKGLKTFDPEMAAFMLRRGLESDKDILVSQQVRRLLKLWQPIAPKTIGMHVGNHETNRGMNHDDFRARITEPLGVNYLGDRAYISLEFTYKNKLVHAYKIVSTHSRFGGQYAGTVGMAAEHAANAYECFDLILFGHTHYTFANKMYRKTLDRIAEKPTLVTRKYYIVNTGTFLNGEVEGYDAYSDQKLGGGVREVGTATIEFTPSKAKINALT